MDTTKNIQRRDIFKAALATVLMTQLTSHKSQASTNINSDRKKPGISLQLYSIRKDCQNNFDKALERVAKMGFDAVEFAGYHNYNNNPKGLRTRLDGLGLKVAGTHIGTGTLTGDNLKRTIDFHQKIDCK